MPWGLTVIGVHCNGVFLFWHSCTVDKENEFDIWFILINEIQPGLLKSEEPLAVEMGTEEINYLAPRKYNYLLGMILGCCWQKLTLKGRPYY